ncbi:MAG: co-chaperone GroES [Flavobacteriales bacterium]|jgi:chaperonin GroES
MSFHYLPVAGTKNRVVILPDPKEEKTASGLYIPESAKEKPLRGTVIAVSEIDEDGKSPVLKAGDVVMYGKYSGQELPLEGLDYLIMKETDVLLKKI